jgi:integrase
MLPRYRERLETLMKSRSYGETNRHLSVQTAPLHKLDLAEITLRTIADLIAKIDTNSGPVAANRCRASLSAYFEWLKKKGVVDVNPVLNTNQAAEAPRIRLLSDDELAAIWRACGDDRYGRIIKLLVLTGARRDEIASLRWSEIDFEKAIITLPHERIKARRNAKIRREHIIPGTPAVAAILIEQKRATGDGDLVFGRGARGARSFSNWSGDKKDLVARITALHGEPIDDWHVHLISGAQ